MEKEYNDDIEVIIADASHEKYVNEILDTISAAAKVRGTGIAKRTHEYVAQKMREGKAVIALSGEQFAGFCYIESWGNKQYVANSGLIVSENFRRHGLARRIKKKAFELSRTMWPEAKLFEIPTDATMPPQNPIHDFLGEIDGKSFLPYFCPRVIPKRYAPTSEPQIIQKNPRSNVPLNVPSGANTAKFKRDHGTAM